MQLKIDNLSKNFSSSTVLDGLTFEAKEEIIFIAGRNGAGKTTFIRIATGLDKASGGSVLYDGGNFASVRHDVEVVFDENALYPFASGKENIRIFTDNRYSDSERIKEICDYFSLDERLLRRPVKTYSYGQKHRLSVAIAMMCNPKYVFLDEPSLGLDPFSWDLVKKSLLRKKEEGCCIIITGQDYEEMAVLADKTLVLEKGKALFFGTSDELLGKCPEAGSLKNAIIEMIGGCSDEK